MVFTEVLLTVNFLNRGYNVESVPALQARQQSNVKATRTSARKLCICFIDAYRCAQQVASNPKAGFRIDRGASPPSQPPPALRARGGAKQRNSFGDRTCIRFAASQSNGENPAIVDPEGGAQDVRRFSTRQDAASKNPGHVADGRFAPAPESFLWLLS